MESEKYIKEALKLENKDTKGIQERLSTNHRLLHAAIGATTEACEILDQLKKHIYYGRELDLINLFEESGDILWYLAIICNSLGFDFEMIMEANLKKLKARYGNTFSPDKAIKRNLKKEYEVLK